MKDFYCLDLRSITIRFDKYWNKYQRRKETTKTCVRVEVESKPEIYINKSTLEWFGIESNRNGV